MWIPDGFLMVVVLQNTQYNCGRFVDLANTQVQEDRGEGANVVPQALVCRPMEGAKNCSQSTHTRRLQGCLNFL